MKNRELDSSGVMEEGERKTGAGETTSVGNLLQVTNHQTTLFLLIMELYTTKTGGIYY